MTLSRSEELDRDLLLLAHGALPLGPRLRVQLHLRRCPDCRARLAALTQTSLLLASAVRGPSLPPWSRTDAVSRAVPSANRRRLPVLIGLVTVLAALCCWIAWTSLAPAPHPVSHFVPGGCRPDLPNSRCR